MIGLVGGSVSAVSRKDGHIVSFFVTLAMMILVNAFMVWSLKKRKQYKTFGKKYGPLCFTLLAVPLVMADLVRHVRLPSITLSPCLLLTPVCGCVCASLAVAV